MKPKVLFIGDLNTELPEYKSFSERYECIRYDVPHTREELVQDLKLRFFDIQAIYGAWLGFAGLGGFTDELVAAAPMLLKVVSICSVGYDGYAADAMRAKDIVLTNVPSDGAAEPVAELVLYNTLAAFRNFSVSFQTFTGDTNHTVKVRKQLDSLFDAETGAVVMLPEPGYYFGHYVAGRPCLSPRNHHAVIVGFGNIGQTIAKRLALIGMHIHYVKRLRLGAAEEAQLGFPVTFHANISDTFAFADLVVIACPITPQTHHLLGRQEFASFAKPIRVVNIGRGPVIDEQALVDALKSGKVLFAGLDVFENEPAVHPDLFGRQDVVLTPHVGASTVENFDYTAVCAMKNIEDVLSGGSGISPVN